MARRMQIGGVAVWRGQGSGGCRLKPKPETRGLPQLLSVAALDIIIQG